MSGRGGNILFTGRFTSGSLNNGNNREGWRVREDHKAPVKRNFHNRGEKFNVNWSESDVGKKDIK